MVKSLPAVAPLLTVFGTLYFIQGIVEPTACLPAQPLQSQLRGLGQSADQIGQFFGVLGIAWSIKPLLGLLSDFLPIAGRRRVPYLLLSTALSAVTFGIAAALQSADTGPLLWTLLLAGLGIALTDVVIDAVAVEVGQPLGLTGQIQSVQWAALAAAGLLAGVLGGFVSQHAWQREMLAGCGLLCLASLALVAAVLREPSPAAPPANNALVAKRQLWSGSSLRTLLAAAAFLFLWNFNPFSSNVLQEYSTQQLGFSEQQYGVLLSVQSLGMLGGCAIYGFICRRVPFGWLIHLSIAAGVASTLVYWLMHDWPTAVAANCLFGLTWQIGLLVQLDLAARVCPPAAAGTLFATLMAVTNSATSAGIYLGGGWHVRLVTHFGGNEPHAFQALVGIAALFTAGCWLLVPQLQRSVLHAHPDAADES